MTSTAKKLVEKTLIVVFGASGDVAKKMTYPALYALYNDQQLPPDTRIIGYARSDLKADKFNDQISGGLGDKADKTKVEEFKKINQYVKGAYDEDSAFQNLEKELQKIANDKFGGESNRVYYFTNLSEKIKKNNYKGKVNRLVIEKPFGKDTSSCEEMMKKIMADWKEEEIYRIDHFLGEEMVRTLPHLRFGNEQLIEPLLNKEKVTAVKVELLEKIGCEGRGGYFDEFGMIRDVLQNHLLQVALMVALEKPKSLEGDALRDEKAMRPVEMKDAVFGQYVKGGGKPGYLEDESVENKQSRTETFSNTVIWIDNEKWKGVPFILCGGKALDTDLCRVTIQLKPPQNPLYSQSKPTELRIELFPEPKLYFMMQTKTPGLEDKAERTEVMLDYKTTWPDERVPGAYETVLRAVIHGDQTMFIREDELIASWKVYTPLLHEYEKENGPKPIEYAYGSSGPKESAELEKRVGFVRSD